MNLLPAEEMWVRQWAPSARIIREHKPGCWSCAPSICDIGEQKPGYWSCGPSIRIIGEQIPDFKVSDFEGWQSTIRALNFLPLLPRTKQSSMCWAIWWGLTGYQRYLLNHCALSVWLDSSTHWRLRMRTIEAMHCLITNKLLSNF